MSIGFENRFSEGLDTIQPTEKHTELPDASSGWGEKGRLPDTSSGWEQQGPSLETAKDFEESSIVIQTKSEKPRIADCAPEIIDEPTVGEIAVQGKPIEVGKGLNDNQGQNKLGFKSDCGLVSVQNMLLLAGKEVTENDVVCCAYVSVPRLCRVREGDPDSSGGTNWKDRQALLDSYGIPTSVSLNKWWHGSLDSIARYVENGHGVNMSVNAGYLWGKPSYIGDGSSNHSVVVTGTARDTKTGELKGLYVCDSGLNGKGASMFIPLDVLEKAYVKASGTSVLITEKPIR